MELKHYGVEGMKWGVRRYQNPDGTLTPEGKARYLNSDGSLNKEGRKAEKELGQGLKKDWYKAYNNAANRNNENLKNINSRYEDKDLGYDKKTGRYASEAGRSYVKEISDTWKQTYLEEVQKMFPASLEIGYDYMSWLPMYYMFDDI